MPIPGFRWPAGCFGFLSVIDRHLMNIKPADSIKAGCSNRSPQAFCGSADHLPHLSACLDSRMTAQACEFARYHDVEEYAIIACLPLFFLSRTYYAGLGGRQIAYFPSWFEPAGHHQVLTFLAGSCSFPLFAE
jgi:hypothetical protein